MRKTASSVVAALVAMSIAGIVCAAEPARKNAAPAPAAPAAGEVKKEETRPARKKVKRAKPARKKPEEKKDAASTVPEKKQ